MELSGLMAASQPPSTSKAPASKAPTPPAPTPTQPTLKAPRKTLKRAPPPVSYSFPPIFYLKAEFIRAVHFRYIMIQDV